MDERPIIEVDVGDHAANEYLAAGWELFAAFSSQDRMGADYALVRRGEDH
jgi:hypothetical protein